MVDVHCIIHFWPTIIPIQYVQYMRISLYMYTYARTYPHGKYSLCVVFIDDDLLMLSRSDAIGHFWSVSVSLCASHSACMSTSLSISFAVSNAGLFFASFPGRCAYDRAEAVAAAAADCTAIASASPRRRFLHPSNHRLFLRSFIKTPSTHQSIHPFIHPYIQSTIL